MGRGQLKYRKRGGRGRGGPSSGGRGQAGRGGTASGNSALAGENLRIVDCCLRLQQVRVVNELDADATLPTSNPFVAV